MSTKLDALRDHARRLRPGRRRVLGRRRLGVPAQGRGRRARRALPRGHRGVADDGALRDRRRHRARAPSSASATRHHVVESHELEVPGFADNPTHRCALCKTELMDVAQPIAARSATRRSRSAPTSTISATSAPASPRRASAARGCRWSTPASTKTEIRALSRELGLRTWDKPQLACLSSRFPYGTQITPDRLRRVDDFEDGLRALGFRQLRVRFHDTIARLEIDVAELAAHRRAPRRGRRARQAARLHVRRARSRRLPLGLAQRGAAADSSARRRDPRGASRSSSLATRCRRAASPRRRKTASSPRSRRNARRRRCAGHQARAARQPLQRVDARVARGRSRRAAAARARSTTSCAITSRTSR